jgi:hypothetical protein
MGIAIKKEVIIDISCFIAILGKFALSPLTVSIYYSSTEGHASFIKKKSISKSDRSIYFQVNLIGRFVLQRSKARWQIG